MERSAPPPSPTARSVPTHLWVVGGLSLLWNAFGAVDYVMNQFGVEAYLAQMTEAQRAYFENFPAWATAGWAFGVWGSLAGSVGLLLRRRWAVVAFGLSVAGMAVSSVYSWVLSDGASLMGTVAMGMSVLIWGIALALLIYTRTQAVHGVLR